MMKKFAKVKSCGAGSRKKSTKKEKAKKKTSPKKPQLPATYTTMTGKSILNGVAGI